MNSNGPTQTTSSKTAWILGVTGTIGVIAFLIYAAFAETIELPWAIVGGLGVGMIGTWLWLDRDAMRRFTQSKGTQYTTISFLMIGVGLAIAIAVNVIANRYDKRFDLTSSARFGVSEQTLSIVESVSEDIEIITFFATGSPDESIFKDLIHNYTEHSKHITVRHIDPLREPLAVQQYEITSERGTVILRSGDSTQRLESSFDEEAVTNSLIRLTSGETHTICLTEGHDEIDGGDVSSEVGMGAVLGKLEGQNYTRKGVNILRSGGVPADCEVLIAADPQVDWIFAELELLAAYVAGGGQFILLLEPTHAPQLANDMARYGIAVGDDIVLEQNPNYQLIGGDLSYVFLDGTSFDLHPITEKFSGMALLRIVRSVSALQGEEAVEGINVMELARTTTNAWAETSLDGITQPEPTPGEDMIGQIPVMAVAEIVDPSAVVVRTASVHRGSPEVRTDLNLPTPLVAPGENTQATNATDIQPVTDDETPAIARKAGGRVLLIGDVDFATNALLDQVNNVDLLLNGVSWMVGEEDQVSIRPNPFAKSTFTMTLIQALMVWLTTMLFVPGITIAGAIGTWKRRRAL